MVTMNPRMNLSITMQYLKLFQLHITTKVFCKIFFQSQFLILLLVSQTMLCLSESVIYIYFVYTHSNVFITHFYINISFTHHIFTKSSLLFSHFFSIWGGFPVQLLPGKKEEPSTEAMKGHSQTRMFSDIVIPSSQKVTHQPQEVLKDNV